MVSRPRSPDPLEFVPLKAAVLEILLALGETPLHGYAILQQVRDRSGGRVVLETGPLYRHLKRLLDDGLVVETDEPETVQDGDDRRRYYTLTALGREVLAVEGRRLSGLVQRGRDLGLITG